LLKELRQLYPRLKVVIFTGYPDYFEHTIALRLGASFYFEKVRKQIPVEPSKRDRFFAALHKIFEAEPVQENTTKIGPTRPLSIFCSYSHRDLSLRNKLEDHLSSLRRSGIISTWHDREIGAGREWAAEIDEHLNASDIILLLISAHFMASDYCNDIEVKKALERHSAGEARVIPIILRPVLWHDSPFHKLQALPSDGKAVTSWQDREAAFKNIAEGIRGVIDDIHNYGSASV
jgi:hypothetical protein